MSIGYLPLVILSVLKNRFAGMFSAFLERIIHPEIREHDDNIYRVSITATGGVNLDKCAEVSKMISPILSEYLLKISSFSNSMILEINVCLAANMALLPKSSKPNCS